MSPILATIARARVDELVARRILRRMLQWLTNALLRRRAAPGVVPDLRSLRRRFAEERVRGRPSREERALALALRVSRERLAAVTGGATCARCAEAAPPPIGRWGGGFCCGGKTENLFDEDGIAALRAGGTRRRHLRRRDTDQAGCLFRGPEGCALPPRHRPDVCLRHLCSDLRGELARGGALAAAEAAIRENESLFAAFLESRADRLARAFCRGLLRAVSAAPKRGRSRPPTDGSGRSMCAARRGSV